MTFQKESAIHNVGAQGCVFFIVYCQHHLFLLDRARSFARVFLIFMWVSLVKQMN